MGDDKVSVAVAQDRARGEAGVGHEIEDRPARGVLHCREGEFDPARWTRRPAGAGRWLRLWAPEVG